MNRYTVLLLLPDFVADTYGIDTYTAHVVAHDPCRAVRVAQVDAATEHHDYNPDPDDFHPLFTTDGWIEDRTHETWR